MRVNNKQRTRFHVMAKPIGPMCNLNCSYCFYLHKEDLLSTNNNWRMSDEVLEEFVKQYIQGQSSDEIIFSWQSEYHDAMIDHDKNGGTFLDKLKELGIEDNTIVM